MMPTHTLLIGVLFEVVAAHFRTKVAVHHVLLNSSQAVNSSTSKLTANNTKATSEYVPGPYDPEEQRYLNGLRLQPHDFQRSVYLFKTMDKDRNKELSATEFFKGLDEEAPTAANAGNNMWKALVHSELSMKPPQFYRFFALAISKPAEFAWQKGERVELTDYFQDEKAKLLRLFITYDADCNDGVSEDELNGGFNNTLLQTVRAAKIPVANLFADQEEMNFAADDFAKFASSGADGPAGLLSFVEFVKLGNEAHRKAHLPPKSGGHQVFGCFSAALALSMKFLMQ